MNIELSGFPATIDILHLGLAASSLLLLILFLIKQKSSSVNDENKNNVAQDVAKVESEVEPLKETPKPVQLKEITTDAALQLLTLLQQDARFIDFIQEDLTGYSDSDIGAAARVVHEGSKKTLNNYFTFQSIRSEEEESQITLPEGFNASEVRLTGNVVGDAPFTGALVHKGWRVTEVKLPKVAQGHDSSIVAAAEVEL